MSQILRTNSSSLCDSTLYRASNVWRQTLSLCKKTWLRQVLREQARRPLWDSVSPHQVLHPHSLKWSFSTFFSVGQPSAHGCAINFKILSTASVYEPSFAITPGAGAVALPSPFVSPPTESS